MSLKLLKFQESDLTKKGPLSLKNNFTKTEPKKFRNKWNFNLHTTRSRLKLRRHVVEKLTRKYYGKKILYLTEPQEASMLVSRSKLLKYVEADQNFIYNNLKSKGNLVLLNGSLGVFSLDYHLQWNKWLVFKKILCNCQKAEITIYDGQDIRLLKYLRSLKNLSVKMDREFGLASIGGLLRNLRALEIIKIETIHSGRWISTPKKSTKNGFFGVLHKLPRLKRVELITDNEVVQEPGLERDLERFYCKLANFKLSINIKFQNDLRKKFRPSLVKILEAAESLVINDAYSFEETENIGKEEKETRNLVKIRNESHWEKFDVARILSHCGSLGTLCITEERNKINWRNFHGEEDDIKGLRNLKVVALKFKSLSSENDSEYEDNSDDEKGNNNNENIREDSRSNFSSPLFTIFGQIKEKCHSLQHLSLYLDGIFEQKLRLSADKKPLFIQAVKKFAQEISTFEKLKKFVLSINPNHLKLLPPIQILSNPGLESFELKISSGASSDLNWDSYFAKADIKSQVRELKITIPAAERKAHLFGLNFLNYIRRLDDLEIVEFIDGSLEMVTFDFLYGFVTSLLEKKSIRKILICTKVINTFFTQKSGTVLSKRVEADLQSMLKTIHEELQGLVENNLKGGQLEEIFVGRLQGYSFDYLFYNKEQGVTEKLFWTEKEMDRLLYKKEELERKYERILKLLDDQ